MDNAQKIDIFLQKVLYLGNFKNKTNLARWLNIDPSSISQWKRTGNIPKGHLQRMNDIVLKSNQSLNVEPMYVQELDYTNLDYIPYYKDILLSAGCGAVNGDHIKKEMLSVPIGLFTCKNLEAVKITGDSMIPTVNEDAIVFIDRYITNIKNGQIYAIRMDNEAYLKRLFQTPDGIIIKSDNDIYPQYTVAKEKLNIIGQVKGVMQTL